MFADDKKANGKGSIKPNNRVSPDAAPTISGEQVAGMAGGVGNVVRF
ncbi:hypothetical protein [Yersinia pekkanenii]|uniref:Rhs accessory genetic element n=1 Tax=Yersinia pekkanenii TaxID=1288385 RepID=A0ABM9TUJ9_9GAMM|nr:hypothetical protein [Yersinia pekkanenii]CRY68019.1 putative Rhs accessory genetic element [Yersinia pekkanenii]